MTEYDDSEWSADIVPESDEDVEPQVYVWEDKRGRTFVGDDSEIARVNRLTAVAEHGFDWLETDDHVHHELQASVGDDPIRVNVPEWLTPISETDHREIHCDEIWRDDGDGIPRLLTPDGDTADSDGDVRAEASD